MIVLDASVLVRAILDCGRAGDMARERLASEQIFVPHLIDLEFMSTLKRAERSGLLDPMVTKTTLSALTLFPMRRLPSSPLLGRMWELRHNLTIYDASYAALAEVMGVPLVTSDAAFSKAPGIACEVELLALD